MEIFYIGTAVFTGIFGLLMLFKQFRYGINYGIDKFYFVMMTGFIFWAMYAVARALN